MDSKPNPSAGRGRGRAQLRVQPQPPGSVQSIATASSTVPISCAAAPPNLDSLIGQFASQSLGLTQSVAAKTPGSTDVASLSNVKNSSIASMQRGASASTMSVASTVSQAASTATRPSEEQTAVLIEFATRPGFGQQGESFNIRTNFFQVSIQGDERGKLKMHHYQINISDPRNKMNLRGHEMRQIFWDVMLKQANHITEPYSVFYDGGTMFYAKERINMLGGYKLDSEYEFRLPTDMRPNKYRVVITYVGEIAIDIRIDPRNNLPDKTKFNVSNFLDLLTHQYYTLPNEYFPNQWKPFVAGGRNFFYRPKAQNDCFPLPAGTEAWRGYFATSKFCLAPGALYLNFDIAHSTFYSKKSLLHFMCDVLNSAMNTNSYRPDQIASQTALNEAQTRYVNNNFRGMLVNTNHIESKRTFKLTGVTTTSAFQTTFLQRPPKDTTGPGTEMSVAEYFSQTYKQLRFPGLPCAVAGSKLKKIYFPIEVLDINQPQKYNRKLNEQQTAAMIKAVCTDAVQRERSICQMLDKCNMDQDPFLKSWGVKIDSQMMALRARTALPPGIIYANNCEIPPRQGVWSVDRQGFYQGATMTQYAFLSFLDRGFTDTLKTFCESIRRTAGMLGIRNFGMPTEVRFLTSEKELEPTVKEIIIQDSRINVFFVAMRNRNSTYYAEVKRVGDIMFGVVTQCLLLRVIQEPKPQTISNILLKINSKLGGINNMISGSPTVQKVLFSDSEATMVMGIDVTHPGPTDRNSPSIAAVVANIDPSPARFGASIKVQKYRREGVVYIADIIRERIYQFYQTCGKAPRRLIVYRDGVSESQFNEILNEELTSIRQACLDLSPGFRPNITFVVVQKRHHVRFFPANAQQGVGRAKNVPPGLIVDTHITHPVNYDFYLCSHAGIQGTSRPAHYHVLLDENKFSADEMQQMTYYLCHMYFRCTRSVSIPAPVYYAHLACARARCHLYRIIKADDTISTLSGGDTSSSVTDEAMTAACKVNDMLKAKMYFC